MARSRPSRTALSSLAAAALLICLGAEARAGDDDSNSAEALFRQGRAFADRGEFKEACAKFEASERMQPSPGTEFNLGFCNEQQGKLASAWRSYRTALPKLTDPGDPRRTFAEEHIALLEKSMPYVVVRSTGSLPKGATIRKGEAVLDEGALGTPLPCDPGPVRVSLERPGFQPLVREIQVDAGRTYEIVLDATEARPLPRIVAPRSERGRPEVGRRPPARGPSAVARGIGWTSLALGVVGLGVSGVATAEMLADKSVVDDDCSREGDVLWCGPDGVAAATDGARWSDVATGTFVAGALLAATGIVVLVVDATVGWPRARIVVGPTGANAILSF